MWNTLWCGISKALDRSEDSDIREEIPTDFEDEIVGEDEHEEDDNEEEFDHLMIQHNNY